MTESLIDIHTDNSQAVIEKVTRKLSEKGVLLHDQDETQTDITLRYEGMSNKRKASYTTPLQSLKDLSEEQIDDKVNEIVEHVSNVIRSGGEKEDE